MNTNTNTSAVKSKRGRKKGESSFTSVTLKDLSRYFQDDMPILVSKKFLENLNLEIVENPSNEIKGGPIEDSEKTVHEMNRRKLLEEMEIDQS